MKNPYLKTLAVGSLASTLYLSSALYNMSMSSHHAMNAVHSGEKIEKWHKEQILAQEYEKRIYNPLRVLIR